MESRISFLLHRSSCVTKIKYQKRSIRFHLFVHFNLFAVFPFYIHTSFTYKTVKGLIAQVLIVCEFTDSLMPGIAKFWVSVGEIESSLRGNVLPGVRFLPVRTKETWLPKTLCTLPRLCTHTSKRAHWNSKKELKIAFYTLDK